MFGLMIGDGEALVWRRDERQSRSVRNVGLAMYHAAIVIVNLLVAHIPRHLGQHARVFQPITRAVSLCWGA